MGGSSGSGSQNTTTQVQQIPQFEQDYAQQNQNIAASLASRDYPTYQGQLIAGFTPQQQAGMQQAGQAATAYKPDLGIAEGLTAAGSQQWNPQSAQQYMNPYAQAALAPQIQQLQLQQGQNQLAIDKGATQSGAFGDARHGVQSALNDYYAGQNLNNLEAQGMNTAYNTGQQAFNADQSRLLGAGSQFGNLGASQQSLGETGANANFNAGAQQQQLTQQQLTEAYNNFMNQVNWPQNELNVRMSALSNSPYNNSAYTSLAPTNSSASNVGAFSALSGLLGGGGSSGSSAGANIFGSSASSDIRLKRDIVKIAKMASGLPVYKFKYLWDNIQRIGVMAQDVIKVMPEVVSIDKNGFYAVDYGRIH